MKSIRYAMFLILCVALIIPILFFTADNENYYYYYTASQQQINSAKAYVRDQQLRFDVKRRSVATSDGSGVDNSTNGYNGYSNGTGVNLMLLAQAQTGYAKEYLEILVKGEKGELGKCKGVTAESLLGFIGTEVGYYSQSSCSLLKSYLPWSNELNGPIWNKAHGNIPAEAMTLSKFGRNEYNKLSASEKASVNQGRGPGRNVFQLDESYDGSTEYSKSNMNSYGTDNSRSFDIYYLPDAVYWEEQVATGIPKDAELPKKEYTENAERLTFCATNAHWLTAGASQKRHAYGVRTNTRAQDLLYMDKAKDDPSYAECYFAYSDILSKRKSSKEFMERANTIVDKYRSNPSDRSVLALCLVLDESDWFVLPGYLTSIGGSYTSNIKVLTAMYQALFDPNATESIVEQKYNAKTKTYAQAINIVNGKNISDNDVARVYGVTTGNNTSSFEKVLGPDGRRYSYYGVMFRVSNKTSKVYKNKYSDGSDPFIVTVLSGIINRTYVSASLFGSYYYALMLKFAGVDVDPTNPDTYMKSLGNDTFVPAGNSNSTQQSSGQASTGSGGNSNGYDLSWIDREFPGVTVRGLTDGTTGSKLRRKYLATLYNWVCTGKGLQYSQNRRTSEGYVDCSSLTMRSLDKADIYKCNGTVWNCDGIAHDGFFVNSCFEFVPAKSLDDLQAGDALAIHKTGNSRHVFVFVGLDRTKDRIVCFNAKSKSLGVKLEYYYVKASEIEKKLQSKRGISSPARNNEDLTACPNGNWYAFRPKAFKQS